MIKPIRLWVEALRSGKYKQGKNSLENSNGSLCCLGVLCKIAPVKLELNEDGTINGGSILYQPAVQRWSGLKDDYGQFAPREFSLVVLNDQEGYTFEQIADVIEKNWKSLVKENKHD